MRMITLLTDFGLRDWFVGTMKGVILEIAQDSQIVDITHDIAPGDIFGGAFALAASCRFFPLGTIHVAVVDPGVGSARSPLAVVTDDYVFVGPDNGLLSLALADQSVRTVRRIENQKHFRHPISQTFHGRDVFAPVAAHLRRGVPVDEIGPEIHGFKKLEIPAVHAYHSWVRGEVIYSDRFGNAITNLRSEHFVNDSSPTLVIQLASTSLVLPLSNDYQAVSVGQPVALVGSSGFIEIAVRDGNAAQTLDLNRGKSVILRSVK